MALRQRRHAAVKRESTPASYPIHTPLCPSVVTAFADANPEQPGIWRTTGTVESRSRSHVFWVYADLAGRVSPRLAAQKMAAR